MRTKVWWWRRHRLVSSLPWSWQSVIVSSFPAAGETEDPVGSVCGESGPADGRQEGGAGEHHPKAPKNHSKTLPRCASFLCIWHIVIPNFVSLIMIVINKIYRSIIISWILNCSEYLLYPRWIFWTYPKRWSRQCCNSYRTERGLGNRKVANDQWMFCSMLSIISACWPWINIQ